MRAGSHRPAIVEFPGLSLPLPCGLQFIAASLSYFPTLWKEREVETRLTGWKVMIAGGPSDVEQGAHWQLEILGAELCLGQELINWGGGEVRPTDGSDPSSSRTT